MRRFIDIIMENSNPQDEFDTLMEAKAYENMLTACDQLIKLIDDNMNEESPREAQAEQARNKNMLEKMRTFAKKLRQDRAVWFLRETRLMWLSRMLWVVRQNQEPEWFVEIGFKDRASKLFGKYVVDYTRTVGTTPNVEAGFDGIRQIMASIEHWQGVPYPKMHSYVFEPKSSYEKISQDLSEIEEEFKERAQGMLALQEGDEVILELPDSYVWVKLDRASCNQEAKLMGHCGNSPRSHSSDRILSLRKKEAVLDGVQFMRPCLTFILYEDGYLGEMKGRGNEKPAEHYHDQIEALLRHPLIKGIRGGGYLPQNNFALADMHPERRNRLTDERPELMTLKDQYEKYGMTDKFAASLFEIYKLSGDERIRSEGFGDGFKLEHLSDEDRKHLFQLHPSMMTPSEYYEIHGMTEELMDKIHDGVRSHGKNNWVRTNFVLYAAPAGPIKAEDLAKLFDRHPSLMAPKQYYERFGMDDALMERIRDGIVHTRNNGWGDGQQWFNSMANDTMMWTVAMIEPEDRKKLFTKYPECMEFRDRYEMFGMTEAYMQEIADEVENRGPGWFNHQGIELDEWKPEDVTKLYRTHPICAPFQWQLKNIGVTEEFVQNVEQAMSNWHVGFYNIIFEKPSGSEEEPRLFNHLDNDKGRFVLFTFKDTGELIEEFGDDDFKPYASPDDDHVDIDVDGGEYQVENFDDTISLQTMLLLKKRADQYVREDAGVDEDAEEDEDGEELEFPTTWKEIVEILKDHDDENYDAILTAVRWGLQTGAHNQIEGAKHEALENIELKYGELVFTTHGEAGHIDLHEEVKFQLSPQDMAKFIDDELPGIYNSDLSEFLVHGEIRGFDVPYYGWGEYCEESAADGFHDNCDLDEEPETNPYKGKLNSMSREELLAAITETYAKIPDGWIYKPTIDAFKTLDDEALREKARYILERYY
jgi:hypothetical protein